MKIQCPICMTDDTLDDRTMDEVSEIVNRHNLQAISYIKILNMIRGKCLNGEEHSFQFEEEFLNEVRTVVEKYKKANSEAQKLIEENAVIEKELGEHRAKIKELTAKMEANVDRKCGLDTEIGDYRCDVKTLTGADDITIWY